jgi:tetratricopeptide (TPR) repeat protein
MSDGHDTISQLSQEGYRLLRNNQIEEAEQRFSRILDEQPTNSYALVGMGDAARKRKEQNKAISYYERCLETDPENSFALFGLADAWRSLRNYRQAVEVWERYLTFDDTNVTVLTRVADGYRKLRNKQRSKELYDRVLELEQDNPYALIGLGHLHYDHREYELALEHWTRMRTLSGARTDIRVLTSIGNCYRKLKRFEEGIPFFEQALERESGNFYALFGLADCYRGTHDAEQSLAYWNRILANDPENRVILTRAGDAYRTLGDLDEAMVSYEKALSVDDDLYARIGVAIVHRLRGDLFAAISVFEELTEREPRNHRVAIELAQTYAQTDDYQKAVTTLEHYLESGEQDTYVEELLKRYRDEQ